jgi:hypothetical protein
MIVFAINNLNFSELSMFRLLLCNYYYPWELEQAFAGFHEYLATNVISNHWIT